MLVGCAMVFIAMAVADKCVIRIHYLRGYGDEAMKSLHLNALTFITVFVAVQMPNGWRISTDINQISIISMY